MNVSLALRTGAALFVLTALVAPSCAPGADTPAAASPELKKPGSVGTAMPRVELPTVGGPSSGAPQVEGRVVLYEFWATWCTPCHVQVEILKELYPKARRRGVEFVGVATGEPADLVAGHLAKHPSPYPVLLDQDERLGTALEVVGLPTLVIVDRTGTIVWRNTSLTDASTLERALAEAGAPAPEPSAPATTP